MERRSCRKALFVFKDNSFVFKDNELSLKTNSAFLQERLSIVFFFLKCGMQGAILAIISMVSLLVIY